MHRPGPGVSLLVNAYVDSMEGIVDYGVGVGAKASPHLAAIEEAQEELRQEYDVREQRRRELEFLEKGGDPLDFKSGHSSSINTHSMSLTDQLAEQYVTSETKGSFAMAASPQGDSVESSGRPGSVLCQNSNKDNLSINDGDNSNVDCDINAKWNGKLGSTVLCVQPSEIRSSDNAKESDVAASFRVGAKGQAYARRNRSRTNRNNPTLVSADQGLHHGNTSSTTACPLSTVSDPKAANLRVNTKTSDDHLDAVSGNSMVMDSIKQDAGEMKAESRQDNDPNNHSEVAGRAPNSVAYQSSGVIGKDEGLSVAVLDSSGTNKGIVSDENANFSSAPKISMMHETISHTTEVIIETDKIYDHFSLNGTEDVSENIDGNQSVILKTKEISDGELSNVRNSIFEDGNDLNDSQLIVSNMLGNFDNESGSVQANIDSLTAQIKTETEVLATKNDIHVPYIDHLKSNSKLTCEPIMEVHNTVSDSKFGNNTDATVSALVSPTCETLKATPTLENSASSELQNSQQLKLEKKMCEDAILKEAHNIEANRKWAGEPSVFYKTSENQRKCHWDFVLEEMSWVANDFMQERLWKITAAAHIVKQITYDGRVTIKKLNIPRIQKKIARTLAKVVIQFWHSVEVSQRSDASPNGVHKECNTNMLDAWKANGDGQNDQGMCSTVSGLSRPVPRCAIQDYAVRFLQHQSRSSEFALLAVAPATPDRDNDVGILELSSEDQHSEESLFYVVPPGAMQVYRVSMESQWMHYKKVVDAIYQEDYEVSLCKSVTDGTHEKIYEEEQGDTCTYILPGASNRGLSSKFTLKKKKLVHQKSYTSKLYEVGTGLSCEPGFESKSGSQPFSLNGKRSSSAMNVGSIPTKRIRTAARRVIPPYTSGLTASVQVTSKTDVSSGETSSLQDDQSSLNGGLLPRKNLKVESTMDFERQMQFDGKEVLKSKKKKKPKHLGYRNSLNLDDSSILLSGKSSYEQRLHVDHMVQDELKDHAKRRLDIQHYDTNGITVSYGQHAAKKPKLFKQLPDTSPDLLTPATGSVPSPVASQMSNMSNSNKLMKIIANRDRGRKSKGLKMPTGYSGTGSQWSNFEDQALVVLVHDMGPNWELVSDAINSALQFKCIFRKPKECKERHKFLIDKSAGDGADSAEDSGSSQPYPSTLPGIPKGSARQLFQRLQGPMEEDTLRAHFDKIISLNQQLCSCRRQEVKQIIPAHSSHAVALSQVCPNYLSGGILTPLDLCDTTTSSADLFSPGYQGSQSDGPAVGNHPGSMTPIIPSGANTVMQGSPGVGFSSLPSPPTPTSISPRDAHRYALPRPTVLPIDNPQRVQQYNPMLSGRNIQQSSIPLPGSFPVRVDRGVRMLAGGNGMGMMCGMPRNMPIPRTGFQGLASAGVLNMVSASNMISSGGLGMQNQINVLPGAVSASGNSMLRPRDSLQMQRPGQNTDMMMQELQLQVSQGNGQSITSFNGMDTSFSNAAVASTLQAFPIQQHQGHVLGNSHQPHLQVANQKKSPQSYAIQQRKLQHRMVPQSHQSFSATSAMSPAQNNSQVHSQVQSISPVTAVPNSPAQNMPRNSQSTIQYQMMRQRQHQQPQPQQQQQQQQPRQQSQQQAKHVKGLGRGNTMLPPNLPGDASQINGPSAAPKSQAPEKHLMQKNQGFFPGSSSMNSGQTKMYPGPLTHSSKQMTPVSDACNQRLTQDPSNTHMVASQQTPLPCALSLPSTHQQPQQHYKSQNQQTIQKMVQQNRQSESDTRIQTTTDQVQINQMTSASISQLTGLSTSALMVSPATPWKSELSHDTNSSTKLVHIPNPSAEIVGSDSLPTSSGQGMVSPQQLSGNVAMHGHGIGGQRQQAPQAQHQLQQPQHQIRQTVQGELSTQPNSAPG